MILWEAEMPLAESWPLESLKDLDDKWAYHKLFGKTRKEALVILKHNPLAYIEDLGAMPSSAFRFYFKVLVEYLLSDESKNDPGAASGIFTLIKFDIQSGHNRSKELKPYMPLILRKIAERQNFYGADIDIFDDFKKRSEDIIQLIENTTPITANDRLHLRA